MPRIHRFHSDMFDTIQRNTRTEDVVFNKGIPQEQLQALTNSQSQALL
jgi:hypothetical protein